MSDYSNIKADCIKTSEGLESISRFLQREYDLCQDDPGSENYDPNWSLFIDNEDASKIIATLNGIAGLLSHLGNQKLAAAALFVAHGDDEVTA